MIVECDVSEENYAVKGTHFVEKDQSNILIRLALLRQKRFDTDIIIQMNTDPKFDKPQLDDLFKEIIKSLAFSDEDFKALIGS